MGAAGAIGAYPSSAGRVPALGGSPRHAGEGIRVIEMSIFIIGPALFFVKRHGRGFKGLTYGPVTRRSPDFSCFRKIARFPRKWPERIITTVPGVRDVRSFAG